MLCQVPLCFYLQLNFPSSTTLQFKNNPLVTDFSFLKVIQFPPYQYVMLHDLCNSPTWIREQDEIKL